MIAALFTIPAIAGLAAFLIRSHILRRILLLSMALTHLVLTVFCWIKLPPSLWAGWIALDEPGLIFLSLISLIFLVASIYGIGYLKRESREKQTDFDEGFIFSNAPEATFTGCLLLFLSTMTLVCISRHFGLMWVAVEATTLASAPLIYFHRHHRSLEATWKYLLICSVGIALALMGNFFLAVSASHPQGLHIPMVLDSLLKNAFSLNGPWLKAAFILFLVGYGTKMGLAPLHTWLPDAHSESPSMVSALLSGALLNCAFLAILRVNQICVKAGFSNFTQELFIVFGLISMAFAAIFILGQTDYKRMLAYSSVEHMGILALGIGLGGIGIFGSMFHAINHSLTKALLFFVAGNILTLYKTKSTADVRGVVKVLPVSGILWTIGFLAITGAPPFSPFISELIILKSALDSGQTLISISYLALLAVIFIGMATAVLQMVQGSSNITPVKRSSFERILSILPPITLAILILILGLYIPPQIQAVLEQAAKILGGTS